MRTTVYLSFVLWFFIGCSSNNTNMLTPDDISIDSAVMQKVSEKKIFFGHHSVGNNIIKGIEDLASDINFRTLNIKKTDDPEYYSAPVFGHFPVGKNKLPFSKIDDFVAIMDSGIGDSVDMAFFKFCFTDIREHTDLDSLFSYYQKKINYLEQKYPNTLFLHFTCPVMIKSKGIKGLAKFILRHDHNKSRNKLSELIRVNYKDKVYDIEKIESTYPNGNQYVYRKKIIGLIPAYTYDDGHLNELGRKIAAKELLETLARY